MAFSKLNSIAYDAFKLASPDRTEIASTYFYTGQLTTTALFFSMKAWATNIIYPY
jgi:hypothetical protein